MGGGSLIENIFNLKGLISLAIVLLIATCWYLISVYTKLSIFDAMHKFVHSILKLSGKIISSKERKYHRDIEIGKIDEKRRSVKSYRFLNDMITDLNLDTTGITPYEFAVFIVIGSLITTIIITQLFFTTYAVAIVLFPIILVTVVCIMYTRGNLAHDRRISAVIESENIICNNIKDGVVAAVKMNINIIPEEVRPYFRDFIDNVEVKNYHVKTALLELNMRLGSMADDFIKKCIVFELEEEHGVSEMFGDIVELNNIKSDLRVKMKHRLDEVVNEIKISAAIIFVFLFGVIVVYPDVRDIYFSTFFGNMLIVFDALVLVIVYVICTIIRATEV